MSDFVACLVELTVATSVGALLVGLLRTALRGIAGARAAYGLWLMLPLSTLTVLLPTPPHPLAPVEMVPTLIEVGDAVDNQAIALAVWATGVIAMLALAVARQRAFVRSFGNLLRLPNGTCPTGCHAAWAVRPDLQPARPDARQAIPAQVRQALLALPAARKSALEPVGQLLEGPTPTRKKQPRRCKLTRAKDRATS